MMQYQIWNILSRFYYIRRKAENDTLETKNCKYARDNELILCAASVFSCRLTSKDQSKMKINLVNFR